MPFSAGDCVRTNAAYREARRAVPYGDRSPPVPEAMLVVRRSPRHVALMWRTRGTDGFAQFPEKWLEQRPPHPRCEELRQHLFRTVGPYFYRRRRLEEHHEQLWFPGFEEQRHSGGHLDDLLLARGRSVVADNDLELRRIVKHLHCARGKPPLAQRVIPYEDGRARVQWLCPEQLAHLNGAVLRRRRRG